MKQLASLVLAVLFLVNSAVVHSQSGGAYPTRALRILVAQAPGGQVDLLARSIAPLMSAGLGQQVVVENRPSASGILGAQLVARSAPDGYTLLPVANTFAIVPTLVSTAGYDSVKDFAGVSFRAGPPGAGCNTYAAGALGQGTCGACQGTAQSGFVRIRRHRHHRPSGRRVVKPSCRHTDAARPLQGKFAIYCRCHGRKCCRHVRPDRHIDTLYQSGKTQSPCSDEPRTFTAAAAVAYGR